MSEPSHEEPDAGLISDEELPEDLRPEENPLARDPGDDPDGPDGPDAADLSAG